MDGNLSERQLSKIINIYYGDKVKRAELNEFEQGLYDFLKDEYSSPERMKLALGKVQHSENLSKEFLVMANDFQISAYKVVNYMVDKKNIAQLDTLFFPMVYLYRQSIELLLKAIYFQKVTDLEERKLFIERTRHDLSALYEEVIALSINPDQDKAGYVWLKNFFDNISMFDRMSDSFRYPYRFQSELVGFERQLIVKKVFEQQKHIDLKRLSNKFVYSFALLNRLIEENVANGCNPIPYDGHRICEFIESPHFSAEFLEEGGTYYLSCVLGDDYKPTNFNRFADAYSETAEFLYRDYVSYMTESKKDIMRCFYSVCYLLRNAIELSLKKLCTRYVEYEGAMKLISTKKHNLIGLWNAIKEKRIKGPLSLPIPHPEQIDFYINLVHEVDGTSSRFRYPVDNNFKPYNPDPYRFHLGIHYHLLNTCFQRIRSTEYFIDDAMDGIDNYRELRM